MIDRHPMWHLVISSLFMYQTVAMVSYFFAARKIAKEKDDAVTGWLLYGGIISIILLLMTVIDVFFGVWTLNLHGWGHMLSLLVCITIPIVMSAMTGYKFGLSHFTYPDRNNLTDEQKAEAATLDESAQKWLKYGIGVGWFLGVLGSLVLFYLGSFEPPQFAMSAYQALMNWRNRAVPMATVSPSSAIELQPVVPAYQ